MQKTRPQNIDIWPNDRLNMPYEIGLTFSFRASPAIPKLQAVAVWIEDDQSFYPLIIILLFIRLGPRHSHNISGPRSEHKLGFYSESIQGSSLLQLLRRSIDPSNMSF